MPREPIIRWFRQRQTSSKPSHLSATVRSPFSLVLHIFSLLQENSGWILHSYINSPYLFRIQNVCTGDGNHADLYKIGSQLRQTRHEEWTVFWGFSHILSALGMVEVKSRKFSANENKFRQTSSTTKAHWLEQPYHHHHDSRNFSRSNWNKSRSYIHTHTRSRAHSTGKDNYQEGLKIFPRKINGQKPIVALTIE